MQGAHTFLLDAAFVRGTSAVSPIREAAPEARIESEPQNTGNR